MKIKLRLQDKLGIELTNKNITLFLLPTASVLSFIILLFFAPDVLFGILVSLFLLGLVCGVCYGLFCLGKMVVDSYGD